MSDIVERAIGDLTIRIDQGECVGYGHCVEEAMEAFVLGDDNVVEFKDPERVTRETLLRACEVCPVEALRVFDADGNQLVP